jgi:CubicO group peptidase (beta-lactamase class C family)
MKKALLSLLTFILTLPVMAQNEGAKFEKIDSLLTYLYNNNKFMGSVSIREKDKVVFEKAYGFADLQNKVPATPDTKYKIGSVTKMFTAAIVFQLIEEKKLTLDTKLSEYFPKIKNSAKITIADMLDHHSGIYNFTNDSVFMADPVKLRTRKDMTDLLYKYEPAFEPREKAEYSNSNYLLLGYIIQDITKKTYKENVTNRIIKKAGLKDTYYFGKINPKKNEAYSYSYKDGQWVQREEWHESIAGAAGALQSTPTDLTKFATALFEGKIIKPESLAEMNKMDMGYGRGLFNFSFAERKFVGHNGGIEGFTSVLGYYPKDNMAFSLIVNAENYSFNDMALGILSCYYKLPYRFPNFNMITVPDSVLKGYEGSYATPSLPFKIDVKVVDGKLRIHADEQGTFYVTAINNTTFTHDAAGVVMEFTPKGFILKQNGGQTVFAKQ